ncbi:MAG TPA: rhomboid family intramembrane serine protease, partial [Armatimonadota bacterium]|nr:rhomboid family intramembrane serine protease [Armatimonadota bacterium]
WIVGTVLEAGIGNILFLLLYIASLIAALLLQNIIGQVFQPESLSIPLIGASGAIAGITGFAAFRYYHVRVHTFIAVPNIFGVPAWFPIFPFPVPFWLPFWGYAAYFGGRELIFGLSKLSTHEVGGVAHWAHLGGMGLGLLSAILLRSYHEGQRENTLENSAKAVSGGMLHYQSLEDLERLLKQNPDDPEVLEAIAGLAMVGKDDESSKSFYLRAIPLFLRGGQTERAAMAYLNVLHHFPNTVLSLREQLTIASALESQGHYAEAAEAFRLLALSYPHNDEAQMALLRAAHIQYKQLQAVTIAQTLLHTFLQDYPDSPWCTIAKNRLRDMQQKTS